MNGKFAVVRVCGACVWSVCVFVVCFSFLFFLVVWNCPSLTFLRLTRPYYPSFGPPDLSTNITL